MGNGVWTRWGRGSCEGYNLSFGRVRDLSGLIARQLDGTWRASIGGHVERIFPSREKAMEYIEFELRAAMDEVLPDWDRYRAKRGLAKIGVRLDVRQFYA